jgi:hypothetical protein
MLQLGRARDSDSKEALTVRLVPWGHRDIPRLRPFKANFSRSIYVAL